MKKTVFLPHEDYRLLTTLWICTIEAIQSKIYYDFFKKRKRISQYWQIFTVNNYYFSFIYRWCQLFGTDSEPTHYKKLMTTNFLTEKLRSIGIEDREDLKNQLLRQFNLTETEHNESREEMKDIRNKYIIHRKHNPKEINNGDLSFPEIEEPLKSVKGLYSILVKILDICPTDQKNNHDLKVAEFEILSIEELINTIKNDIPEIF